MTQINRVVLEERPMSTLYRMLVHCDRKDSGKCYGLKEYTSPDRIGLARAADRFVAEEGWLRGYRQGSTYDVCPGCQTADERKTIHAPSKETADA